MAVIQVDSIIVWGALGFIILLFGLLGYMLYKRYTEGRDDFIIMLSKVGRWRLIRMMVRSSSIFKLNTGSYTVEEKTAIPDHKGRILLVYSEGKPEPMHLEYSKSEWLTSDALTTTLDNELLKRMVQLPMAAKDILMLIGAIAACLALIASVINLLKTFGVLK